MNPTHPGEAATPITVYDKNGQPYEADLVEGEKFRALEAQHKAAAEEIKRLHLELINWREKSQEELREISALRTKLAEAEKDADRMAGALEHYENVICIGGIMPARDALAAYRSTHRSTHPKNQP